MDLASKLKKLDLKSEWKEPASYIAIGSAFLMVYGLSQFGNPEVISGIAVSGKVLTGLSFLLLVISATIEHRLVQEEKRAEGPKPPVPSGLSAQPILKVCPRCAEDVKAAAQVCRFCGHEFTGA